MHDPTQVAGTIREAIVQLADEWSEHRAMGQDRGEWFTWRCIIDWLTDVQVQLVNPAAPLTAEQQHAYTIARAAIGHLDPRDV